MDSSYYVKVGDCITSSSSSYQVQQLLGSGGFGVVTLCRNNNSGQTVALKVLKRLHDSDFGQKEAQILRSLKEKGSESYHIVQWIDSFQYRGHFCHEFEKLDISLQEFQFRAPFESLTLKRIRPILTQMVGAMLFLKSVGIIHCDLKPDNVMMIDHVQQPLRIKLIDFGLACAVSDARPGQMVQTVSYRAPEVALGSSFTQSVDMWSVGCIAVEMFLGKVLFRVSDNEELIQMIVQILGQPPKHVLDSGRRTRNYFSLRDGASDWTHMVNEKKRRLKCTVPSLGTLYWRDPYNLVRQSSEAEDFDRAVFIDLLKRMLDLDPQTRISPETALDHPFLTLTHLAQKYHEYSLESKRIQLRALDLYREEQPSTSSTALSSPSSPQTPEALRGQTSGLKRKREEEESTRKRSKKDPSVSAVSSVQRSGEVCKKSPDVSLLESGSEKWKKVEEKGFDQKSAEKKRKRKSEEPIILDSFSPKMKRKDSDCEKKKAEWKEDVIDLSSDIKNSTRKWTKHTIALHSANKNKKWKDHAISLYSARKDRERKPKEAILDSFSPNVKREEEEIMELESVSIGMDEEQVIILQTPSANKNREIEQEEESTLDKCENKKNWKENTINLVSPRKNRKRKPEEPIFLDSFSPKIKREVEEMIKVESVSPKMDEHEAIISKSSRANRRRKWKKHGISLSSAHKDK